MSRPSAAAAADDARISSEARGGPDFQEQESGRRRSIVRSQQWPGKSDRLPASSLMASSGKTPPSPGLAVLLESVCEPRRRVRLPVATMSEGARKARTLTRLWLRLSAEGRPRSYSLRQRPPRVDEGGGPAPGRLEERTTC